MRKLILMASLAILPLSGIAVAKSEHHRGCNTHRCDHRVDQRWAARHPMRGALASWYDDAGPTACGIHARYGVAHKTMPCGARLRVCHDGCVTAVVQDRGPFVAGREFDLNPTVRQAIGCSDLCWIRVRRR